MLQETGNDDVRKAGAAAGIAVFSITLAAACATVTFLCSYAQGYGFSRGFREGSVDKGGPAASASMQGATARSSRSYLRDDED